MKEDIQEFVRKCSTCQEQKLVQIKTREPIDKFDIAMKTLKSLQEDLDIFFAPSLVVPDNSFIPYTHALSKRSTPLEFIGWTSRQLFGTMDAGDRDQLNQDVGRLYERTANMSTLLASQTHIVKSNLESLHQKLNDTQTTLHEQHLQFLKLANRTNQLDNFANRSTTVQTLLKWVYQFDQSLEHSINSYKTLVNTIETATRGYLHPLLFTHEQLQSILKTLNGHTLPWEHRTITVEILHAMSKVSVDTVGEKLILILEFPLSDKARYSQYKIHPLPIPQEIMTNATSYVTMHQKVIMCPPSLPFNIDNDNSPCEFALLARPTQATLRTCKLAISTQSIPYWEKLRSTDEWLYSVIKPTQMRIMCNDERKVELTINGTRIFTLRGQCYGHTNQNRLYGVNVIEANETYLYNPGLKFDLKFSTDSIMKTYKSFNEVPDITNADKRQIRMVALKEEAASVPQKAPAVAGIRPI
ncbi:hypothetical protein TSAR_005203 [Trichomalopsis sarcophagae]|uniref:Uncharacterized protein n=1 Tax=Trichomalopsis sarcophagae TaxID=543379 RepID=A0A232EFH8_9HYME|nr:hypothetical protein TSAR_005203 [Trichomalopsis sarcophagae]